MSTVTNTPIFNGITKDMLTKILRGRRAAKIEYPLSVSLDEGKFNNSTGWLLETDYTLAFKYRASIDQDLLYNNPSADDMIKDQAVKALNNALYGDIREDLNKVIDSLFNNPDIYDVAKALRKIVDKIRV